MRIRPANFWLLALVFILFPALLKAQDQGSWSERMALSQARQETPLIHLDGKLYQTGGLGTSRTAIKSVEVFDIASNNWSVVADLPITLHHHGGVATAGKVFTIGGYSATQFIESTRLHAFSPGTGSWSTLSPVPRQIGAHASVEFNGEIYIFGGTYFNAAYTHAYKYTPSTDSWTELQPLPFASEHLSAAVMDNKIYVTGGRLRQNFVLTNRTDLQIYDPDTDSWQIKASMRQARAGHASASVNSRLYVFGGESFEEGPEIIRSVEEYDPVTDTWRFLDDMPEPRHGLGAVVVNSQIWLSGGGAVAGFSTTSNTAVFTPPSVATFSEFEAELPSQVDVLSVYPNPTKGSSTIELELNEAMRVGVRVLDVMGREVASLPDRLLHAGVNSVSVELDHLSAGSYFVAMRLNDHHFVRELQVVK